MLKNDWEFNVLGVYNYRKSGPLCHYMDYIIEHHDHIDGDVCEAGVFKGRSLLATGLLLKELGSSKQVFGYDSFQGFPPIYHDNDDISKFDQLLKEGKISEDHYAKVQRNLSLRSIDVGKNLSVENISLSGDFSGVKMEDIQRKVEFLGLDNVHLVPGPFADTMTDSRAKTEKFAVALLDCDLYLSYKMALPFIWKRLTIGGYIFLDEYYSLKFPGGRIATDEFFATETDKPHKHNNEPGDFERWYVRKLHKNEGENKVCDSFGRVKKVEQTSVKCPIKEELYGK